mgnify:CR=1 FL=1|jgi:glycosyltransferase involved in cell wall biosynthesis
MISVCIATYNGGIYLREQLDSILVQLGNNDEVIISDDSSTDDTLAIVESYHDNRIVVFPNQKFHSPIFNFENALRHASGNFIFLSDQDDVWEGDKVKVMLSYLSQFSLVVSNCSIIDKDGKLVREAYFNNEISRVGVLRNLIHNNYLGCCMAFRKEVLDIALPFPSKIAMHDIWIGLCADMFFSITFIPNKLICYRRHGNNVSATAGASNLSWIYRISYRIYFLYQLIKRTFRF